MYSNLRFIYLTAKPIVKVTMNKLGKHVFSQFVAVISISLDQGTHFKMIAAQQWAKYHLVIWPLPIIFNSQGNNII